MTIPSSTLVFSDSDGAPFGVLRISPLEADSNKADCIFDVVPRTPEQEVRPEVRWLAKRHYVRASEHRLTVGADGSLTIQKGSFSVVFDPAEGGGFTTRPPSPPVTAFWEE